MLDGSQRRRLRERLDAGFSSGVTLLLWYGGTIYEEAGGSFIPDGTAWALRKGSAHQFQLGIQWWAADLKPSVPSSSSGKARRWLMARECAGDDGSTCRIHGSDWAQIGAKCF